MDLNGRLHWSYAPLKHPKYKFLRDTAVALVGGFVYVHGYERNGGPIYVYSLKSRKWRTFPLFRKAYLQSILLIDDKLIILGGAGRGAHMAFEELDIPMKTFKRLHSGFKMGEFMATVFVASRREIIIWGDRLGIALDSFYLMSFNVDTKRFKLFRWAQGQVPVLRRVSNNSILEYKGHLFIVGVAGDGTHNVICELKLGSGYTATWTLLQTRGQVPYSRFSATFQIVHGLIVGFGGISCSPELNLSSVFAFSPETQEALEVGPDSKNDLVFSGKWPGPTHGLGSIVKNDKILLFSGYRNPSIIELTIDS